MNIQFLDLEQLEALQKSGLLDSLYETFSMKDRAVAHYRGLNPLIKGRVRALKRIQLETVKIEVKFYKELAKLEQNFVDSHQQLFTQRRAIVNGGYEPTEEETSVLTEEEEEVGHEFDAMNTLLKSNNEGDAPSISQDCEKLSSKGIPGFWLTVLKHAPLIYETVKPADIPVLKYLEDVRSKPIELQGKPGFQLEFEFAENPYFANKILSKRFIITYDLKEDNPFSYDGPEVTATEGCSIEWLPGKNLTMLVDSKTHRNRLSGEKQTLTRSVSMKSFFQFFEPAKMIGLTKGSTTEQDQKLLEDYDLGQYLKERVIPRAVAYFTGDALDLENEEDEFDEESDEDVDDGGVP